MARLDGDRIVIGGKNAWAGLGNRSGLHSYADTAIREKWERSGRGLVKKLLALEAGTTVEVHAFRNKTRDRGSWFRVRTLMVSDAPPPGCYHLKTSRDGCTCAACGADLESLDVTSIL